MNIKDILQYGQQLKELVDRKGNVETIECPSCHRRSLEWIGFYWRCNWRKCDFSTTKIPSPNYMGKLVESESLLKDLGLLKYIRKIPYEIRFKKFAKSIKRKKDIC